MIDFQRHREEDPRKEEKCGERGARENSKLSH
jgi:hypothetical protein